MSLRCVNVVIKGGQIKVSQDAVTSCNNVASALDGNIQASVSVRTRPLGQLKGEGRAGGGGGEIRTEFNCAECNFFESPYSVFWFFSPLFSQTLCVHCHGRKDASQRRANITACSDPCWTPVTLQNITCFNGIQRKAGQFPTFRTFICFKYVKVTFKCIS